MAKIAWLGEPTENEEGPRVNHWNGIAFPRGEEVEVDNEHMIRKAMRHPAYSVDGVVYVPDGADPHPNAGAIVPVKTDLSEMNVAELRALAVGRGIDVEGLSKAEIREKLA